MAVGSGALDAHHAGFAAGADDRIGLNHGVVLLVHPALGADVAADEQRLEVGGEVAVAGELGGRGFRRLARYGRLPRADGTAVERRIVGERLIGNVGDQFAVMADAQARLGLDSADDDGIESPLGENAQDFVFPALLRHQQHALLAFGEHDLVRAHGGFALGHAVELDVKAHAAARAHLAGGAGEAGGAHVLDADDGAGFMASRQASSSSFSMNGSPTWTLGRFCFGAFLEFLAGHGGAVDAVAAGLGADVNDRVAGAGGFGVEDLVLANQAEGEGVDQRDCRCSRARTWFRRPG